LEVRVPPRRHRAMNVWSAYRLALVEEWLEAQSPERTIWVTLRSAGPGSGWVWFHAEQLVDGRRTGPPVDLPVRDTVPIHHAAERVAEVGRMILDRLDGQIS
jgi:hypothetical protein